MPCPGDCAQGVTHLRGNPEERRRARVKAIAEDLRAGRRVTDFRFDSIFSVPIHLLSEIHWTPVEVATRSSELLAPYTEVSVLDVGSGCGKFCLVGALSSGARFTGIERRLPFVEEARSVAKELGLDRVTFIHGDMRDLDWAGFDAVYLFNPFHELKLDVDPHFGEVVPLFHEKFRACIETVKRKLGEMRPGTRVVTYHGFGGSMPASYHCMTKEPAGAGYLELWVKLEAPPR